MSDEWQPPEEAFKNAEPEDAGWSPPEQAFTAPLAVPENLQNPIFGAAASVAPELPPASEALPMMGEIAGGTLGGMVAGGGSFGLGTAAGVGLGAMAGRKAGEITSGLIGKGNPEASKEFGQQVIDMGMTGLRNFAGSMVGGSATAAAKMAAKRLFVAGTPAKQRAFAQAVADADRWGVPISVGEAGGRPIVNAFDEVYRGRTEEVRKAAQEGAADLLRTRSLSYTKGRSIRPERIGNIVKDAAQRYTRNAKSVGYQLDNNFFQYVPEDTSIPMANTLQALQRVIPNLTSMPGTTAAVQKTPLGQQAMRLLDDINKGNGNLNFGDVRTFRRMVSESIAAGGLVDDMNPIKLKDLHGALTADLGAAAAAAGPGAEAAWQSAQSYWKRELTMLEDVVTPLVAKGVPEKITKALSGSMKDGTTVTEAVWKTLTDPERDLLRGAVLRKLGWPKQPDAAGAAQDWSFNRFLSDWAGLDNGVKNVIFRDRQLAADLTALANTSAKLGEKLQTPGIPTYATAGAVGAAATSPVGESIGKVKGWMVLPVGFAITSMGAAGGSNLMRNRAFVHWLATATEVRPNGVGAHLGRLTAIAKTQDDQTKEDIAEFLTRMGL